jgi:hypothetical protein
MNLIFGLVVLILIATIIALVWLIRRRAGDRERAEAARAAAFVSNLGSAPRAAEAAPAVAAEPRPAPVPVAAAPASDIALQKMLFEAAHKAGEAGEPALAIQLYARLLARFPSTSFAEPARAAAAALKKKLVKA